MKTYYPTLRPVEIHHVEQAGRPMIYLRDPLQLTDSYLMVPQAFGPILALCDGTTERRQMRNVVFSRYGVKADEEVIDYLLSALDEALLLENDHFREALTAACRAFRQAEFRRPTFAGASYPADPEEVAALLDAYLAEAGDQPRLMRGCGLISPHIDYARGGSVYARLWKQAAPFVQEADLVVIVGTDHYGGLGTVTLTRQNYATPYGVLPTDQEIVDQIVAQIGEEAAFSGELRHRSEHSIELVALWLHHIRGRVACPIVPILVGSFSHFINEGGHPANDPTLQAVISVVREAQKTRRVLVVASGDLSHVGPAFGGRPIDQAGRERIASDDAALLRAVYSGSADSFFSEAVRQRDQNNVCGISPFYMALKMMGGVVRGRLVSYDMCPADDAYTSLVSVCGLVWE